MLTYEDRLKFEKTWDSSKDPIIEDGKTLPQLLEGCPGDLAEMWYNRMEGFSDQATWRSMLLN